MAQQSDGNTRPTPPTRSLAWFERQRVSVPEPVEGYYDRPAPLKRLTPTAHRIVLLKAPCGFGKTTLLAECCRRLNGQGVPTAWLCADAGDDRAAFEAYLAFAFIRAGIDAPYPSAPDAEAAAVDPIGTLLDAVEAYADPCVLALDELERISDDPVLHALNTVVRRAPPNLHIAIACRELPRSLNIAAPVLAGSAVTLSADELRFSKADVAGLSGLSLSRPQLAQLTRESAGWPIALRLHLTERASGTPGRALAFRDVLGAWLEARLFEDMPADHREFLLDLGLFDRVDPDLVDEVLDGGDSRQRLRTMPHLDGLIEAGAGPAGSGVLHPLIRDHCSRRRFRETPARFRLVHRGAAEALERRGETIPAAWHAAQAGDRELVRRILEDASVLRSWVLEGPPPIEDIEPFLSSDIVGGRPRLALARCVLLVVNDRIEEARRVFESAATETDGFARPPTDADADTRVDHCIAQTMMVLCGCPAVGAAAAGTAAADLPLLADDDSLDPRTRGAIEFGLWVHEDRHGTSDAALERAERAHAFGSDGRSPYLAMHVDYQRGSIAMAQGEVEKAEAWYARGLKTAKAGFPHDAMPALLGDVLLRELELERNRLAHAVGVRLRSRDTFARAGNTFATHAAESAIVAEVTLRAVGAEQALDVLAEMWEYARRTDRPALVRYLSAQRASVLAGAGRIAEAERTWRTERLPIAPDACVDLHDRHWREMEALACARLQVLAAHEAFDDARALAARLVQVADAGRLVRTAMRAVAMSMTVEHLAGDANAAAAHLGAYLDRYAATDYARPIVREGDAGRAVLARFLESNGDGDRAAAAYNLLEVIGSAAEKEAVVANFGARELQVLERLETMRDKAIATELGITQDGIRYHVRRIFAKLGARSRHDAVHRARALGIVLPDPEP